MKVFVVGHRTETHTNTFIHAAATKAFMALGFDTTWGDPGPKFDPPPWSIIFTKSDVDQHVPVRNDLYYILHNCDREKYAPAHDHLVHWGILARFNTQPLHVVPRFRTGCGWWYESVRTLLLPWATNLLPGEIDDHPALRVPVERKVHWVGTVVHSGTNANVEEVAAFARGLAKHDIEMHVWGGYTGSLSIPNVTVHPGWVTDEKHRDLIERSYLGPVLCGSYQLQNEYVPCRAFKNASYGQTLCTNSVAVRHMLGRFPSGGVVYEPDCELLAEEAVRQREGPVWLGERWLLTRYVRQHHTFIERLRIVLEHLL